MTTKSNADNKTSLKEKLRQELISGDYYKKNMDTVCCKYKNGSKTEYDKMTQSDCLDVFFGEVVDDGNCS